MKILIIGGTRFLGRHLVTAALARDLPRSFRHLRLSNDYRD